MRIITQVITFLILICLAWHTAGCGMARQVQLAEEEKAALAGREAAQAECDRLYPDKLRKPVSKRIACINDAVLGYNLAMQRSFGRSNLDVIHATNAKRLVTAERYDNNKLSAAEYEAELAQISVDANNQIASRHNSTALVSAAQQQANAATTQAVIANQQAITASQPPKPVTCNRIGNSVTCN